MGILRTLYALTVVLYHSWPTSFVFVGGENAVQCFYIISGFLISYILVERKSYTSLKAFYLNRYLRLYPIYVVVAVLTLIVIVAAHRTSFTDVYRAAPLEALVLLAASNALMFGQDWLMFLGVRHDHLVFVTNFLNSDVVLYRGQIIHPAWTLGLELSFYLIAPFVLPKRRVIYVLIFMSLCLRLILIHLGFGTRDPWTYRFFPTELALFLFGALAQQLLLPIYERWNESRRMRAATAGTAFLVVFSLVYFLIPIPDIYKRLFLILVFTALVPLTFIFQRQYRFDGWIGNLSYPIYIGHLLVLWICSYFLKRIGVGDQRLIALVCMAASIAFAIFLNRFVAEPFERLRNKIRARSRT